MHLLRRFGLGIFVVCVLAPAPALAAGWSLWPFSQREELRQPPATRQMTGMSNNWNRQTLDNDDPSILNRMTGGTQRFVSSTKQALSFGGDKKPSPTSWSGKSTKTKKKSSGSLFGWLRPAEPEGPRTMKEWFSLERPE